MLNLCVLGSLELRDPTGKSIQSVLVQPKRCALLVYLALHEGYPRRDVLLSLFWPELDSEHARASLRQAIHHLRRSLGAETIGSRGDEEIGVASDSISCDAVEFRRALGGGDRERALELYSGDLLPGFFLEDLPEFERWLEGERKQLREGAALAACELSEAAEKAGDIDGALRWTKRELGLSEGNEAGLRRLLVLLNRKGERAGALRAYEDFCRELRSVYDLEPSAETRALAATIRANEEPDSSASGQTEAKKPLVVQVQSAEETLPVGGLDTPRPSRPRVRRWMRRRPWLRGKAILGGVVVVLAILSLPFLLQYARASNGASIAVLPIANISEDPSSQYLAEGMTDELISTLGNVPGLSVTSRTSAYAFEGSNLRVREIGRRLQVDNVLEGSMQREGDRVRFSIRLIDISTGRQRWSESYDRELTDVLAIRDEIGTRVVTALRGQLAPGSRARLSSSPTNPAAYDDYLRARFLMGGRAADSQTRGQIETAVRHFSAATEKDPGYALAHAGLADALIALADYAEPRSALARAKQAAEQAIRLNDDLAEAHLALANIRLTYDWDWAGAEAEYRRAIEIDPENAEVRYGYARFLRAARRFEESLEETRRGLALERIGTPDTLAFTIRSNDRVANALLHARRYDAAMMHATRALELDPTAVGPRATLALARQMTGDPEGAVSVLEVSRQNFGDRSPSLWRLGSAYAQAGNETEARAILKILIDRSAQEYVPKGQIGALYLALGDVPEALKWFESAIDDRPGWGVTNYNSSPRYEELRRNPEFRRLLLRINAPA